MSLMLTNTKVLDAGKLEAAPILTTPIQANTAHQLNTVRLRSPATVSLFHKFDDTDSRR